LKRGRVTRLRVRFPAIHLQLREEPHNSNGLSRLLRREMRRGRLCTMMSPHLELFVGSLYCFPPSSLKSTPRNSAWSNEKASYGLQSSYGRSCSASPQAKAEHSLGSHAATIRPLIKRSLAVASTIG
jgi:hypothetical protein